MRKIIRNMKEQEFSIKQTIYRDKLRSYMSGRNFLKIAQKKSGKEWIPEKRPPIQVISNDDSKDFSESLYSSDDEEGQYKDKTKQEEHNRNKSMKLRQQSQQGLTNIKQSPLKEKEKVKDLKNFYHISNMYGGETLSTDRLNVGSKTIEDEQPSKMQVTNNTSYKFLSNDRYETRSNVDDSDHMNISHESPKTKASIDANLSKNNHNHNKVKNENMDGKPCISFARCETNVNEEQSIQHNLHEKNDFSMNNFLTSKSLKFTPTLLLKQQKLLTAARQNKFLMIKNSGFIIKESDVNVKDNDQYTALYYAVQNQNIVFIRWLFSKGANVNIPCGNYNNTPVHEAFRTNNPEMIHDILCMKPNFNLVNGNGMTPLAYASLDIMSKFNLKNAVVFKNDANNENDEIQTTNNNGMFINDKKPLKAIGKLKLNSYYPIKTPTIKVQNYTSL